MLESIQESFNDHVRHLQDLITDEIKKLDPKIDLLEEKWQRQDFEGADGGGGRTRAFTGDVIENAGVNTSLVYGKVDPEFAKKIGGNHNEMWASGISLIIHPRNPRVPTVHANFRMIKAGDKFWFGGGADLTPYYPYKEDFEYFHNIWKKACDPYGCYNSMKEYCDRYFVNHHRQGEMRGIGGIFFDHHNTGDLDKDYNMVKDLSNHFIESFFPIAHKRYKEEYTPEDEEFQLFRHGLCLLLRLPETVESNFR